MSILKILEELYVDFLEEIGITPTSYIVNEQTLDNIIDRVREEVTMTMKSNEQMIEEGVRYRGVLFTIDNELEDEIIIIN